MRAPGGFAGATRWTRDILPPEPLPGARVGMPF